MISKVEPLPGTQDVYLDAPKGQVQPKGSTPEEMDSELDAVAGEAPAAAVDDDKLIALDEAEARARDRKADVRDVESALLLFEMNCAQNRPYQWQHQERWAKRYEEERIGKVLHSRVFIKKLAAVGVELRANDYGRLGRIGINALACPACKMGPLAECAATCTGRGFVFRRHEVKGKLTAKAARAAKAAVKKPKAGAGAKTTHKSKTGPALFLAAKGERTFEWMTLATLHNGATPEYSVMRFDQYGVPTNEKYHGWRTALLDLMFAGVVSRRQAVRAFGKVERVSEATEFYLQQFEMLRW